MQVFTADGRFVRAWGEGIVGTAHQIKIDRGGNVWLADVGLHIVRKCTQDGKVLLTIGTPGKSGEGPNLLNKPTDMAIAPNGDVFISDGYGNSRVAHFDRNGKFIKAWGTMGTGPRTSASRTRLRSIRAGVFISPTGTTCACRFTVSAADCSLRGAMSSCLGDSG